MAETIQDIMTKDIHTVRNNTTLLEVARLMRDKRIGDVLVLDDAGKLKGIVTDRDIVVRADADGKALDKTTVGAIHTDKPHEVQPTTSIDEAVRLMREHAVRRLPVVSEGKPIGIVSIGDIARHKDPKSVLGQISTAAPNN